MRERYAFLMNTRISAAERSRRIGGAGVVLCVLLVILAAGITSCGSSDSAPSGSFHGSFETFGSDGPTVDFVVSDDGAFISSFSVNYLDSFGWGVPESSTASSTNPPGSMDFMNVEKISFKPELGISDGRFSYTRQAWSSEYRIGSFEGQFVSPSDAAGTVTIVHVNGKDVTDVGQFKWTASAQVDSGSD